MFKLNGWVVQAVRDIDNVSVFKPDFYDNEHIIATSNKAIIVARGYTSIEYKGVIFETPDSLLSKFGKEAIQDFSNWDFSVEKEWVIVKDGEWITSFTTLDKLPKTTTYRC